MGGSCPHPWRKDCGLNSKLLRSTPKTISSWEDQISGILKQGTVLLSIGDDLLRLLLSLTENTLFTLGIRKVLVWGFLRMFFKFLIPGWKADLVVSANPMRQIETLLAKFRNLLVLCMIWNHTLFVAIGSADRIVPCCSKKGRLAYSLQANVEIQCSTFLEGIPKWISPNLDDSPSLYDKSVPQKFHNVEPYHHQLDPMTTKASGYKISSKKNDDKSISRSKKRCPIKPPFQNERLDLISHEKVLQQLLNQLLRSASHPLESLDEPRIRKASGAEKWEISLAIKV